MTEDLNANMLRQGKGTIHESLLDSDEKLAVGSHVLVHDGDITYVSATVTATTLTSAHT